MHSTNVINFLEKFKRKGLRWTINGMGRTGACNTFILDILLNLKSMKTTKIESQVIIRQNNPKLRAVRQDYDAHLEVIY